MCSICGIVSVPAGSPGYGSDPGCRTGPPGPPACRHAPVPATGPTASPAFSTPRRPTVIKRSLRRTSVLFNPVG
jgi:hypothetical protein